MNKGFFLVPQLLLVSSTALAGTMGEVVEGYRKVITLSGGPAWTSRVNSQNIYFEPELMMSFKAHDHNTTLGTGEAFFGVQHSLRQQLTYQLGLAISGSSDGKLAGNVWIDDIPEFNDYLYKYKISHTHVAVKGKLLADIGYVLQPYLSASLGAGFNRAKNFSDTPTIFEQLAFPNFGSHTKTAFTYTVGAGVQTALNANWGMGLGYEFADWGKSRLDPCRTQLIGTGLKLNHLYTHQLQFSLSYLI